MDCAAVKPRMEALVSGSLPEPERALAEQHISVCEGCRLELELVRAIGSQEKPPAVGQDDWTLDRIFGSESQQGHPGQPGSVPASGPPPPASAPDASPFPTPGTAQAKPAAMSAGPESDWSATYETKSDSTAASGKKDLSEPEDPVAAPASWDFEPADANAEVKPPEESLFFATEALSRRRGPEKKGSSFRVVVWVVGGLIGAGLLAFSSWFVLNLSGPGPGEDDFSDEDVPSAGDAPGQETPGEGSPPAVPQPADEDITPTPDMASEPPEVIVERAPAPRAPRVSASSGAQPPPLPNASRAPGSVRLAPPTASHPPARSTPPATRVVPPSATGPKTGPTGAPVYAPPPRPKPWVPPPDDDEIIAPEPAKPEVRSVSPPPDATAGSGETKPLDSEPAPAPPPAEEKARSKSWLDSHAGSAATPPGRGTGTAPRTTAPPAGDNAPAPEALSPIDRLHLATVDADERGDLAALRRLRGNWKSFISKMGVGPQRARAKREYADCLWAIQTLTGSRTDQKSALAAYREYLLGAPAGGADSRSVSRLRQLEDALTEKR
jgi:hypothetical protein